MGAATMSRPKTGPDRPDPEKEDRSGRKSAPVQVKKDLAKMVAIIATHDDVTQADLLDPVLRQWAITNYRRVMREIGKEIEGMDAG